MTTKEQMDIFSKNLRKYVSESGKEQKEMTCGIFLLVIAIIF